MQERSRLSATGSVNVYAGRRFPSSFDSMQAALERAAAASDVGRGAVAVLERGDRFYLARAYNAEYGIRRGWHVVQSQLAGERGQLRDLHPDLRALVHEGQVLAPR